MGCQFLPQACLASGVVEHLVPIAATNTPAGKEATWALSNLVTTSRSVPAASALVRMGAVPAFIAGIQTVRTCLIAFHPTPCLHVHGLIVAARTLLCRARRVPLHWKDSCGLWSC